MKEKSILSIVTPTKGNFSDYWLEQLLKIKGNVQFILVYPPDTPVKSIDDPRVTVIISPYKGEVMQRFIGLLNTQGDYVLALDDDDFAHPDILECTAAYFKLFPESWVLRLKIENIDYLDEARIKQDWEATPVLEKLEICKKTPENPFPYQGGNYKGLLEVPIAPLDKNLDIRQALFPWHKRTDMDGLHFENFVNRVWRNDKLQLALAELSQAMKIIGPLTWIPAWNLDRALGLFVQAKFFQQDAIIGHAMPKPEQIRYITKDQSLKEARLHLASDALLLKCYPQYGYLWNLFFWQMYKMPKLIGRTIKQNLRSKNKKS
jgi:hypothetical protein